MNLAIITGNLGADPELRFTQNQTPVASLSLATQDPEKKGDQWENVTEWHRVTVWGKQAENASKYLKKGSKAAIRGRLKTRSYTDKDGVKRYSTEIIADKVEFLDSKGDNKSQGDNNHQAGPQQQGGFNKDFDIEEDIPF